VTRVPSDKIRPGDVLIEGVVLEVERVGDEIYLETALGTVAASVTETVQVIARFAQPETASIRSSFEDIR
jgi:hypothetical protein